MTDLDGTIVLRGPTEGLTKILPTISRGSSTEVKFRIEDTDTRQTVSTNREGIDKFANDSAAQIKKTRSDEAAPGFIKKIFKTDTDENLTSLDDLSDLFVVKDTKFEIEPDPVRGINFDEDIGKVIRNENGKRTVIVDQDERKAVIEAIRKKLTDSGNDPGVNNTRTNKIQTESESFDETFQPNRKDDVQKRERVVGRIKDTNEVNAGRSPDMVDAVKTATRTRSVAVEQFTRTFSQEDLADLGLAIKNDDTWIPLLKEIQDFFGGARKRDFDDFSVNSIDNIIAELPFTRQELKLKIENGRYVKSGEVDTGSKQFVFKALKGQADQNILKKSFQDIILRGQKRWLNADDLVDVGDVSDDLVKAIADGGLGESRVELLASKNRLISLFKKLKDEEITETATREYNVCRRT